MHELLGKCPYIAIAIALSLGIWGYPDLGLSRQSNTASFLPHFALDLTSKEKKKSGTDSQPSATPTLYTINFKEIPAHELLRFVGKICEVNFLFQEEDLDFHVSIFSQEPVPAANIMIATTQLLRAHKCTIVEQEKDILVVKAKDRISQVNQVSTPDSKNKSSLLNSGSIITRAFSLKNSQPTAVARIIQPLTSSSAFVEPLADSNQLIITDIAANLEKIAELISYLDTPQSTLDLGSYTTQYNEPKILIELAKTLMKPFANQKPLILTAGTNCQVFIVSTPFLIAKTLAVLEELDSVSISSEEPAEMFLYQAKHREPESLLSTLSQIINNKQLSNVLGGDSLKHAIETAQEVDEANSIVFFSSLQTLKKITALLEVLDLPIQNSEPSELSELSGVMATTPENEEIEAGDCLIYKIHQALPEQIQAALDQVSDQIEHSLLPQPALSAAIKHRRWIQETNALSFTGTTRALQQLRALLSILDVPPDLSEVVRPELNTNFLIYAPKFLTGESLVSMLEELTTNLSTLDLSDPQLIAALRTARWVTSSNALVATGAPHTIEKLQKLISSLDMADSTWPETKILIFRPQFASFIHMQAGLETLAMTLDKNNLSDLELFNAIDRLCWHEDTASFMATASHSTIDRLKSVLQSLDVTDSPQEIYSKFVLYKLTTLSGATILEELKRLVSHMDAGLPLAEALKKTIDAIQWIETTNSFVLTGPSEEAINYIVMLIKNLDDPEDVALAASLTSDYWLYLPTNKSAEELFDLVKTLTEELEHASLQDHELLGALGSIRLANKNLLFTGTSTALQKIEKLVPSLDLATTDTIDVATTDTIDVATTEAIPTTLLLYKLQWSDASTVLASLNQVAAHLTQTKTEDHALVSSIRNAKYIKESSSLLFIGSQEVLKRIENMLQKFDFSDAPTEIPHAVAAFNVYSTQYQFPSLLLIQLRELGASLEKGGFSDPLLFEAIENSTFVEGSNLILISGAETAIQEVKKLLVQLDQKGEENAVFEPTDTNFYLYKLQHHQGGAILDSLKELGTTLSTGMHQPDLIATINSLQLVPSSNAILITGSTDTIAKIKPLIADLDQPERQVLIEVLVIETSLTNTQNFGLMWGARGQYKNNLNFATGNFPMEQGSTGSSPVSEFANGITGIPPGSTGSGGSIPFTNGFDLGVIGDLILLKGNAFASLGSLVNALQLDSNSSIIMNPKIIAQNNQKASIFIGQNVPFTGAVVSTVGQNSQQTTSNIEYRNVGVTLAITAILGDDDIITIDITQDISEVMNTINSSSNNGVQLTGLQTSEAHMETRVHVPNEHFVALSGMLQDSKARYKTGIPCLGGLPWIGALFSEDDRTDTKQNVLIFIRPQIIANSQDLKTMTARQEHLLKSESSLPVLKEEIDAAIELLKTVDNEP